MKFIDEIVVRIAAGDGGDGCVSFRRERFVPRGGPDGGDGGRGGSLVMVATRQRNTLVDYRRNKLYKAENGRPGQGRQMYGRGGADLELPVPVGTVIYDAESGDRIADLDAEGARFVLEGGAGGKGNMHFKSAGRRTPRIATPGREGAELTVRLELKLIADIGLLGFPNAGKSTFIAAVSAARPRVADYPFTTLTPSLGVVQIAPGEAFVIADIPGLIEGAAEGAGLGHRFLRHIERCAMFLHLVSCSPVEPLTPVERYQAIRGELQRYGRGLARRNELILLTQVDLVDEDTVESLCAELEEISGSDVVPVSSITGRGVQALKYRLHEVVQAFDPDEE